MDWTMISHVQSVNAVTYHCSFGNTCLINNEDIFRTHGGFTTNDTISHVLQI
jgi:hypothetical protein